MPLRPYRPKVKGILVQTVRNVPECKKCIKKGIACSGLGIRHRFSNGVASRGHCVGKDMETAYSWMKKTKPPVVRSKSTTRSASNGVENNYDNGQGPTTTSPNFNPLPPFPSTHTITEHTVSLIGFAGTAPPVIQPLAASTIVWGSSCESDGLSFRGIWNQEEVQRSSPCEDEIFTPNNALILPSPLPDHVPAWKRCLMLHFSSNIACEMIAVDGPHNGWRYLVLPVADRDELVMDAVLAVSLFHRPNILQHIPLSNRPSRDFYARAIRGLQSRSQLYNCDQHSVIVTILLLLTAVMVNGSSDFPILFGMLQSAIEAMGGDATLGSGEMAEFLIRQVRK
ncbi:acriflavine sensitivity control protein acr-2 [Fusarium bulbicola]|nr:acriflavine sensitivity control protein acr-2 [Fusarium bulbicola]